MEQNQTIKQTFPVGPLQCNCTIIGDLVTKKAMVIDPGGDAEKILSFLNESGLQLVAIIHTHAHLDHILASGELKKATGAEIYLHDEDRYLWDTVGEHCKMLGLPSITLPAPDHQIHDGQDLGCCDGVAIHTPGHTPGSVSFWFSDIKTLVAGDTLFRGSIGRTDFPGGDFDTIVKSIRERLYTLDDDAEVITGHGPSTVIGLEKQTNMFVKA